jgi:2-dehydro-3-deoxy-D-arabinonate dehydratase
MKAYKLLNGIALEQNDQLYLAAGEDWNSFINDDGVLQKASSWIKSGKAEPISALDTSALKAPIGKEQELWACGVTYLRSKIGRQEESKDSGGADFYAKVYEAERPEVFFKATPHRVVGHGEKVRIRKDSTWDVPEPELTLVVTSSGKIVGYTIGNDMSSRSIEGENPLYLPQAKTYDACAAVGPCVYITDEPIDKSTEISLTILRNNTVVFNGSITLAQMKRTPAELVSFVYREASFPSGCLIMTGTGVVPDNSFTLQTADEIQISISSIGTLVNSVA